MATTRLGFLPLATTFALFSLCPTITGQFSMTVTSLGGSASATGDATEQFSLPVGPLPPGGIQVTAHGYQGTCTSSSSVTMTQGSQVAVLGTYATLGAPTSTCTVSADAWGEMVVALSAPTPTEVTLTVELQISGIGSDASVDFGYDGIAEFVGSAGDGTYSVSMILTSASTIIHLFASSAPTFFDGGANIILSLAETAGTLHAEGALCGPALGAHAFREQVGPDTVVRFATSGSTITPYAFFVVGVQPLSIPIPPFGCVLGTEILAPVPTIVDPTGRASLEASLPSDIPNTFRVQYLAATLDAFGNPEWRTSNVARITIE